jgi:ribonuclease P protein component
MLPKKHRLTKKDNFDAIHRKGRFFGERFIAIKSLKNNLSYSRFGFLVGLKVSKKAVVRNKIKRRIRESVKLKLDKIKPGFDIVVLTKPEITEKDYSEIKKAINSVLEKGNLLQ